ncbi:hypothetical protein NQ314_004171 [Rhamnusium bicolor]|uniref:Regulatory protein zeste n=1 Tax=Rhamnusium bicolor TaxID=1586634 RepID=A0AAV8ZKB6_9CUCU|nr:hypothetical protein NQ314_004171 [Rhamnusium bicolor]
MSKEQKTYLIQYVEEHRELQSGKLSQQFTFKKAQCLWKELANILNSMPGARKDWEKWRKTWHDLRNLAKSKGASIKKYQKGTGGGPPPKDEVNSDDDKILGMISSVAVGGHENITESKALFIPYHNIIIEEVANVAWDHNYNVDETDNNTGNVNIVETLSYIDINNENVDINSELIEKCKKGKKKKN